jgi:hypothetical protein
MRFDDLLQEADQRFVVDELEDLLVRNKARGFKNISTPLLKDKLEAMGYVVDMNSLVRMLGNIPIVGNVDANTIELVSNQEDDEIPTEEPPSDMGEPDQQEELPIGGPGQAGEMSPMGMGDQNTMGLGAQPQSNMGGGYSPGPQISPEQHRDEVVGSLASKQLSRKNK